MMTFNAWAVALCQRPVHIIDADHAIGRTMNTAIHNHSAYMHGKNLTLISIEVVSLSNARRDISIILRKLHTGHCP